MLGKTVGEIPLIPDLTTYLRARHETLPRWRRLSDQLQGTHHPGYLRCARAILNESCPSTLIAFWGTLPLPDAAAIKKVYPHLRIILNVLCHPLACDRSGIARQNFFMRHAARHIDALIFPSKQMEAYFDSHIFRGQRPPTIVIPPCWPAVYLAATQSESVSQWPNIIYTGRTDFDSATALRTDDIRQLLDSIVESGIELHHCSAGSTMPPHERRKVFAPMPHSELIKMSSRYDASLIAYNTTGVRQDHRFQCTVFDRLITSVAAGVPIAIPRHGYAASKDYLSSYPTIEFDTPAELRAVLMDRDRVRQMRKDAWAARSEFVAERHQSALHEFIDAVHGRVTATPALTPVLPV